MSDQAAPRSAGTIEPDPPAHSVWALTVKHLGSTAMWLVFAGWVAWLVLR